MHRCLRKLDLKFNECEKAVSKKATLISSEIENGYSACDYYYLFFFFFPL